MVGDKSARRVRFLGAMGLLSNGFRYSLFVIPNDGGRVVGPHFLQSVCFHLLLFGNGRRFTNGTDPDIHSVRCCIRPDNHWFAGHLLAGQLRIVEFD